MYETLAHEGDTVLNVNLLKIFNQMNIRGKKELEDKRKKFHNEQTLIRIGNELEIQKTLSLIDSNQTVQDKDKKETIEALLGASERHNHGKFSFEIVENLYKIAVEKEYFYIDYISDLKNLIDSDPAFQEKQRNELPGSVKALNWENAQDLGNEIVHAWTIDLPVAYFGKSYYASSDSFPDKDSAKRDAAKKFINISLDFHYLPKIYSIRMPNTKGSCMQPNPSLREK